MLSPNPIQMKTTLLLFIMMTSFLAIGQDATTYEKISKAFQEYFNTQDIEAVYNLYAPEMQKEMTKEGITRFVTGIHEQFGNLNDLSFVKESEGIYSYTATFENISLVMDLLLNSEGKIETIQFQEP